MESPRSRKRSRSRSPPPPWRQPPRNPRQDFRHEGHDADRQDGLPRRRGPANFSTEQTRRNQAQEDAQSREWLSKEDGFVLKQSKKKAGIRVREGRAKPIDWLVVTLSIADPTPNVLDDDDGGAEMEAMDPEAVVEELGVKDLSEVAKDVEHYLVLEANPANRAYWSAMKVLCEHRRRQTAPSGPKGRTSAVSADVDRLLRPKTLDQLNVLERQIDAKLQSNEPIDVEYWEDLLESIGVYKAKAQLRGIYQSVLKSRLRAFKQQQLAEAISVQARMNAAGSGASAETPYSISLDPEPMLKVPAEDKALKVLDESEFLASVAEERQRVAKICYVPSKQQKQERQSAATTSRPHEVSQPPDSRFVSLDGEDFSSATKALYDREVARGVQEDEEIFTGEEEVSTAAPGQWAGKYRPRKPRYFNRVQMGYEWNKYNQTHYDHENPPPKVVQGYKFNIFYPDLIDKTRTPTYRIERENGRKKGQSFAPAGEEDTCLIRFMSGPPYEDVAFRIVDKEWDYSAKRERGFRSSFDKGILQLHFQFKKVYYRK